jgi:hypothetical protein
MYRTVLSQVLSGANVVLPNPTHPAVAMVTEWAPFRAWVCWRGADRHDVVLLNWQLRWGHPRVLAF